MTAHLAHLATLGIIKEASASALGMLSVIQAQITHTLKRLERRDALVRSELEDVLMAIDNARHILTPAVVLASQEHNCQIEALRAADGIARLGVG